MFLFFSFSLSFIYFFSSLLLIFLLIRERTIRRNRTCTYFSSFFPRATSKISAARFVVETGCVWTRIATNEFTRTRKQEFFMDNKYLEWRMNREFFYETSCMHMEFLSPWMESLTLRKLYRSWNIFQLQISARGKGTFFPFLVISVIRSLTRWSLIEFHRTKRIGRVLRIFRVKGKQRNLGDLKIIGNYFAFFLI